MVPELLGVAQQHLSSILEDVHASAKDPAASYQRLAPGLVHQGWFDLPGEEFLGGVGAPILTAGFFALAGRYLAPGPLLESIVMAPVIRGLLPSTSGALQDTGSVAWVDGVESVDWQAARGSVRLVDQRLVGSMGPVFHLAEAEHLLVVADAAGEIVLLLIPGHQVGVERDPLMTIDPCSTVGRVMFDTDVVPDHVLARGPEALEVVLTIRALSRIALSAELQGITSRLVEMAVGYAGTRQQFGRPIGSFQSVKHILADIAAQSLALGSLVDAVVESLPLDSQRLTISGCVANAFASETAVAVAHAALQVHGGIGFTEEHPLHLFFKRALVLETRLGTTAELHRLVGAARLATGVSD